MLEGMSLHKEIAEECVKCNEDAGRMKAKEDSEAPVTEVTRPRQDWNSQREKMVKIYERDRASRTEIIPIYKPTLVSPTSVLKVMLQSVTYLKKALGKRLLPS